MALFSRSPIVSREPCGLGYVQLQRLGDEALMQHLALGHDDALAVLYDRYHRLVFAVALKILRDRSEAEDVTQDVFMKLYRTVAQFDAAKGMTKMWMLRLAYQVSLNRRRYVRLRTEHASDAEVPDPVLPGSDTRLAPAEASRLVAQLLDRLDGRQRRAIQLAYLDGLSMNEIAERTGESVGNVRHHYYRGIARLRALLSEHPAVAAGTKKEAVDGSARQLA